MTGADAATRLASGDPPSIEQRRFPELSEGTFRRVCEFGHTVAGLAIAPSKKSMIQKRLSKRLEATGLDCFDAYLDHATATGNDVERDALISALVTNITSFFRENHHFETLATEIMPELADNLRQGKRVRIWSAGCSEGCEPHSIAMTVLETLPDAGRFDFKILATDIDTEVLQRARNGEYTDEEVDSIPPALKTRYVAKDRSRPAMWKIDDRVRELIAYRRLNLKENWPMTRSFDVIFCRNVIIYFDQDEKQRLLQRISSALGDSGWLFLGHSERIPNGLGVNLSLCGTTTYRQAHQATTKKDA